MKPRENGTTEPRDDSANWISVSKVHYERPRKPTIGRNPEEESPKICDIFVRGIFKDRCAIAVFCMFHLYPVPLVPELYGQQ